MSPNGAGNSAPRPIRNANTRRQLSKYNFGLHEIDEQLEQWLAQHHIDEFSKTLILNEGFTFEDFIYNMEKLDLMRLGLRLVFPFSCILYIFCYNITTIQYDFF